MWDGERLDFKFSFLRLGRQQLDDNVVQRHFPRLLRDEQPGIRCDFSKKKMISPHRFHKRNMSIFAFRTNTAVCLGKIAPHLHHSTRQKVLLPAFTGKLRDPFPPARIAAVNALAATQQFFTIAETANRRGNRKKNAFVGNESFNFFLSMISGFCLACVRRWRTPRSRSGYRRSRWKKEKNPLYCNFGI